MGKSRARTTSGIRISSTRVRGFISRRNNLISIVFAAVFLACSCGANTVWDIPFPELRTALSRGEYAILESAAPRPREISEVERLGPGGGFYIAEIMRDLGRDDLADDLLSYEAINGSEPWKRRAALLLLEIHLDAEEYDAVGEISGRLLAEYPEDPDILRAALEALYWLQQDEAVLTMIDEIRLDDLPDYHRREVGLFEAVALARLGREGWRRRFVELFSNQSPSSIHLRADGFLDQEDRIAAFAPHERALMDGVDKANRGDPRGAVDLLEPVIRSGEIRPKPEFLLSLAEMYRAAGLALRGGALFDELAAGSAGGNGEISYALLEGAGKLYRWANRFDEARLRFLAALDHVPDHYQRDRMRWYVLDVLSRTSPDQALSGLTGWAADWSTPGLFEDAAHPLITALARKRDWGSLEELYRTCGDLAFPSVNARLEIILASAISSGIYDSRLPVEPLLERAAGLRDVSYYSLLAAAALGRELVSGSADSGVEPSGVRLSDADDVASGFIDYGLLDRAYGMAREELLEPGTMRSIAAALNGRESYLEGLRVMSILFARRGYLPTREDLETAYPRAFVERILTAANRDEVPVHVFYGMIREESFFDPEIVSRAGAVGLGQLMPATALDVAGRLRMTEPDLEDPETNLRLSAWYLAHLVSRLESISLAVYAYNAGITRVRGWASKAGGLPDELFLETIPIDETRTHGRKVLVSSAVYGYLYFGIPVGDTVRLYFGNFGLN